MSAVAAATADPGSSTAAGDPTSLSTQEDVGGEAENLEEVVEVDGSTGGGVPVIKPALTYTKQGDIVEVPDSVVKAVDEFRVPNGFVRKGAREQSYIYSLGVYCEKTDTKDHKFYCLASSECRRTKKMFLYVNFEHIPALKDIPMIAAKDIRACLPARFTGGDDDLAAAEAAFDVVNNTANSDIGL